jgi:hypothetical protein
MTDTIPAANRIVTRDDNALIDIDRLRLRTDPLEARLADFEKLAGTITPIKNTAECAVWQDILAEMDVFGGTVEESREETKTPFETALKLTNNHYFALHAPRKGQEPGRLQVARGKIATELLTFLEAEEARQRAAAAAEQARLDKEAADARQREQDELDKAQAAADAGRQRAATNAETRAVDAGARASVLEGDAYLAGQQAQAKPRELATVRSDSGTKAAPAVEWSFTIPDLDKVKGQKLWAYVTRAAKEAAIRAYIKDHAPKVLAPGDDWQPIDGVTMNCGRKLALRR